MTNDEKTQWKAHWINGEFIECSACSRKAGHSELCGNCLEVRSKPLVPINQKAIRFDDGKPAYHLIPANALHELVLVYSMGAKKYSPRNWEKGMAYSRMFASMMRHAWAFWRGEDKDVESGLHHMAHVAFGALGLVEYSFSKKGEDDRVC